MTTINQVGVVLSGVSGTGNFAGTISPTFVTPVLGAATATSLAFNPTTGGIIGTTTNDNVTAGDVGEFIIGSQLGFSNFTTTATYQQLSLVALTAGDWDVYFNVIMQQGNAGIASFFIGALSTSPTTLTLYDVYGIGGFYCVFLPANDAKSFSGYSRISLASSANIYMIGQATWASGNAPTYSSQVCARRAR